MSLDHDRPLSKTGRADAVNVSHQLHKLGWIPELILCRFVNCLITLVICMIS